MGAPNKEVTVLILSSVGAKAVLAIRSQIIQKTPPPIKVAGMITSGFAVPRDRFMRNGTAIPTKEIGPANAVTVAESTLDKKISNTRKRFTSTPIL